MRSNFIHLSLPEIRSVFKSAFAGSEDMLADITGILMENFVMPLSDATELSRIILHDIVLREGRVARAMVEAALDKVALRVASRRINALQEMLVSSLPATNCPVCSKVIVQTASGWQHINPDIKHDMPKEIVVES